MKRKGNVGKGLPDERTARSKSQKHSGDGQTTSPAEQEREEGDDGQLVLYDILFLLVTTGAL